MNKPLMRNECDTNGLPGKKPDSDEVLQENGPEKTRTIPGAVHDPFTRPVSSVFRNAELHGAASATGAGEKKKIRARMLQKAADPDEDVTYRQFEAVFRHFICTLLERQDRLNREQNLQIVQLRHKIDLLERRLDAIRNTPPAIPPGGEGAG